MQTNARTDQSSPTSPQPWWRYRMVWLVIGGPLVVVVASLATAVVAVRGADPVMTKEEMEASAQKNPSLMPAIQARNNAATAGSSKP
ncbi:MAG: hypothetical protein RLZZ494_180 [Pseudomonadota bacterium]|nr:hypothetical protein [Vitreoscilla filiformis]